MLVTLVLFGLISTLLWQALAQVALLETRLSDPRVLGEGDALQRAWVHQALSGSATGAAGELLRFAGQADRVETWTTQPPWPTSRGLERMTLRLLIRDENKTRITEVHARRMLADASAAATAAPGGGDTPPASAALWRWEGEGRFEYLDPVQGWLASWPPAGAGSGDPATALPRAIRLLGAPGGPLLVTVIATQNPLVRRADLSVLEDDSKR